MHACRVVRHRVAPALVAGLATASLSLISTQAVGASPPRNGAVAIGSSAETGELFGVAATPGGDAWAVGYSGTNPATKSLILYWNGSHWKPCRALVLLAHRSAASPPHHPAMHGLWAIAGTQRTPRH